MTHDNEHRYDDIINLPYNKSVKHKHMSIHDRAAQFAPFAALTGYDDSVKETARQTDNRIDLSEDQKSVIDSQLRIIDSNIADNTRISLTYFVPDSKKSGGKYITVSGYVKKIDHFKRIIILSDGLSVSICDIINLEIIND